MPEHQEPAPKEASKEIDPQDAWILGEYQIRVEWEHIEVDGPRVWEGVVLIKEVTESWLFRRNDFKSHEHGLGSHPRYRGHR